MAISTSGIGTLREQPLHAELKAWYARDGGEVEVPVDGYVVDVVRDSLLIEIQTTGFAGVKRKLSRLSAVHPLLLVYPVATERWLVTREGTQRKSPKHGTVLHLFDALVSFPHLALCPNFSLEVALIHERVVRHRDARRSWRRRGWVVDERQLIAVVHTRRFEGAADFAALLPAELPQLFTTADLAHALGCRRQLAQRMVYCLREMGALAVVGKSRRALLYRKCELEERACDRDRASVEEIQC